MRDQELLQAWLDGDEKAAATLMIRLYGVIRRFFRNKVPQDIEDDLIQQTIAALTEKRRKIETNVAGYTVGIARNVLCAYIRTKQRAAVSLTEHRAAELLPGVTSILTQNRKSRVLLEALRELKFDEQMMVELYYWEGYSIQELAVLFEVKREAMKGRLYRARRRLRSFMEALDSSECTDADIDTWARELRDVVGPDLDPLLT